MSKFDPAEIPLSGINLVEASAGTGKTYAISSLYVRLLVETRLAVKEILVVTFTNAATDELNRRIRRRIKEALDAFSANGSSDPFLEKLNQNTEDKETAKRCLLNAIRGFDEAAIFTIHGFCLRMLSDYAFESCSLFDTNLIEDNTKFMQEIVNDFWRNHAYSASPNFIHYVSSKLKFLTLSSIVRHCMGNPFLAVKEAEEKNIHNDESITETECLNVFREASSIWKTSRDAVISFLMEDKSLNRKTFSRKVVETLISNLDAYFLSGYPLPLPEKFNYICFDVPVENAFKGNTDYSALQTHPFFSQCSKLRNIALRLAEIYDDRIAGLKKMLFEYARTESSRKKQEQNVRSFDDLLFDLYRALTKEGGKQLANLINKKYKAALIDEFQDTDPLQYEIFKHIYGDKECILFIIGDPKQSIYSFRGADIFAYITTVKDIDSIWTLGYNFRSSERIIKAVNTIFENAVNPFVFSRLSFVPVMPGNASSGSALTIKGAPDLSPFKIWLIERTPDGKPVNAGTAREMLYKATADEIVELLTMGDRNEATIDGKNVSASDIAIIVRTNREARNMQKALNKVNIPGVIYSSENIFATREATEIKQLIAAIAEPSDESRIKVALVTDMLGTTGNQLSELMEDETAWNDCLERFESYRNTWLNNGLMNMARRVIAQENIKSRLLAMQNGERRLTNVLHCLELLHGASVKYKLSIEGTLKWLDRKMALDSASNAEEYQIRLETDEMAVKIITIHRSKGLEYPIIFCPFCWSGSELKKNSLMIYHDEKNNFRPTLDISMESEESSKRFYELEQLAENVRLLYVSLTRAKYRCYLAYGSINTAETSAVAYILHPPENNPADFSVEDLKRHFCSLSDSEILSRIKKLEMKSGGAIEVLPFPKPVGKPYKPPKQQDIHLAARIFRGTIKNNWRISSFSSITSGREKNPEAADRDKSISGNLPIFTKQLADIPDIFNFPRGTKAGSCLHAILEQLDFSLKSEDETRRQISECLTRYGIQTAWTDAVFGVIKNVLGITLDTGKKAFKLSLIDMADKIHEIEFYMPIELISPTMMASIFSSCGKGRWHDDYAELIKKLDFNPVKGMLRGFVDMVFKFDGSFYIIDWKSNYLGSSIEDYNQAALKSVMQQEFYFLQYHLYTAAINSFLSFRENNYSYNEHFGGVFYMFLRGIDMKKGQDYGIFFDRPPETLITELTQYLRGATS